MHYLLNHQESKKKTEASPFTWWEKTRLYKGRERATTWQHMNSPFRLHLTQRCWGKGKHKRLLRIHKRVCCDIEHYDNFIESATALLRAGGQEKRGREEGSTERRKIEVQRKCSERTIGREWEMVLLQRNSRFFTEFLHVAETGYLSSRLKTYNLSTGLSSHKSCYTVGGRKKYNSQQENDWWKLAVNCTSDVFFTNKLHNQNRFFK